MNAFIHQKKKKYSRATPVELPKITPLTLENKNIN